jgi:hypothetical protein
VEVYDDDAIRLRVADVRPDHRDPFALEDAREEMLGAARSGPPGSGRVRAQQLKKGAGWGSKVSTKAAPASDPPKPNALSRPTRLSESADTL